LPAPRPAPSRVIGRSRTDRQGMGLRPTNRRFWWGPACRRGRRWEPISLAAGLALRRLPQGHRHRQRLWGFREGAPRRWGRQVSGCGDPHGGAGAIPSVVSRVGRRGGELVRDQSHEPRTGRSGSKATSP